MKRRTVIFALGARRDLAALYDWIAEESSERVAGDFVETIERYCLSFDLGSQRGRRLAERRRDFRAGGFRRKATVVFEVLPETVRIMRIFRAGRDWTALFPDAD